MVGFVHIHSHILYGLHNTDGILLRLLDAGMVPIITHPGRNVQLQQRLDDIARWVEGGCYVQVTASSYIGLFGKRAKVCAAELMKRSLDALRRE